MSEVLDRPGLTDYAPPALEPLGSLRSLTKGAGPGGMPIVMQTGLNVQEMSPVGKVQDGDSTAPV